MRRRCCKPLRPVRRLYALSFMSIARMVSPITEPDTIGNAFTAPPMSTAATTKDEESAARELFTSANRTPSVRPLTFARERDARIVRKDVNGSISVVLNILTAKDEKARQMSMVEGIDASTGEALKAQKSKARIIVPLTCSLWHEQKFLGGKALGGREEALRRDLPILSRGHHARLRIPPHRGDA